jgi:hypothetical protein
MVMAALRSLAFSSDRIDFTHIAVTVVANTPRTRATTETSAIALRILRSRWRCVMSP